MRWLAVIHVAAALTWCIAALRLPGVVGRAIAQTGPAAHTRRHAWQLFIGIATPAALATLVSGTALRAAQGPDAAWPLLHLTVASLLVWTHGATVVLLIRLERRQHRSLLTASRVLCACTLALLLAFSAQALLMLPRV